MFLPVAFDLKLSRCTVYTGKSYLTKDLKECGTLTWYIENIQTCWLEVIFVVRELQSLEISQQHLVILDLLLKLAEEA